jgi:hypothetical protein
VPAGRRHQRAAILALVFAAAFAGRAHSPVSTVSEQRSDRGVPRIHVERTQFALPDGASFSWRGITAFRLVDNIADGEEPGAVRFLDWAAQQKLTVVRVLTMMSGLFELRPEDGRRALPRVLELAAQRGLYVEVVALANTAQMAVDLQQHVSEIGRILARHSNGVLEIANEPVHPSQSAEVHKPEVVRALAARVPGDLPVSLGSIERGDGFGAGTYITWHAPRESGGSNWRHVTALAHGAELIARWKKPVVSDEPIGAGAKVEPGRRDDSPDRFRAAALLTRLTGAGATFHYDAGIHARIPAGRELDCFRAWNEAWTLLPANIEGHGSFAAGGVAGRIVRHYDRAAVMGVYERADSQNGWVLVFGNHARITLSNDWRVVKTIPIGGGALLSVTKG